MLTARHTHMNTPCGTFLFVHLDINFNGNSLIITHVYKTCLSLAKIQYLSYRKIISLTIVLSFRLFVIYLGYLTTAYAFVKFNNPSTNDEQNNTCIRVRLITYYQYYHNSNRVHQAPTTIINGLHVRTFGFHWIFFFIRVQCIAIIPSACDCRNNYRQT